MVMKMSAVVLVVGVLSIGLAGCASSQSTYGSGQFTSADVATIKKGKTTKAEILHKFGQPGSMYPNDLTGDEIWSYSYIQSKATVRPQSYIPIVGAFVGGVDGKATGQTLTITLAKSGVVKDYRYNESLTTTDMSLLGGSNTRSIQTR